MNTEISQLVDEVTKLIAPFVPFLLKGGEKAFEEVGKKVGESGVEKVKLLWNRLQQKTSSTPALEESLKDVANAPDDSDSRASMRLQIKKLLTQVPSLADEIAELMKDQTIQRVLADQSSTINRVRQSSTKNGMVQQDVAARDNSVITDVEQTSR